MPNDTRSEYDVIVVGGGPGGSTAAYQLEAFGYDVLLIDRKTFPRDKLCGGIITYKTLRLFSRVFDRSETELLEEGVLNLGSNEYAVYFNEDQVWREDIDVPFYFAKRFEYDEYLHERAVEAGTDTHLGDGVRSIDVDSGTVETVNGETFQADYVVGADGATSRIRQQLSEEGLIDTDGWERNLAIGVEAYVPREEIDLDIDYPLLHFGVLDWGYGWVFPNTDRLLVGVGGLNRKNETGFREILAEYFDILDIEYEPDVVKGHPIPFGNYLEHPAHDDVLLIGDAAGTVDAITGEGIFYAQRSGELAAWAIKNAESSDEERTAAEHYVSLLKDHVHPELRDSKRARLFVWGGPQYPRRLAMKAWFSALSDPSVELVHGIRIYEFLRRRGEKIHESVPRQSSD
jgi:geranylgeranyl reductase family protein